MEMRADVASFRERLTRAAERGCVLLVTWGIVVGGLAGLCKTMLRAEVELLRRINRGDAAAAYLERMIASGQLPALDHGGEAAKREEKRP